MSEAYMNEFDHYNYDQDKYVHSSHSGKQRTKREAMVNTNRADTSGHSRKLVQKMQNTERKQTRERRSSSTSS